MSAGALTVKAGPGALRTLRRHGFAPELVQVMAGASGGPKWLVLGHLDRVIVSSLFDGRREPLHLVGSSIGAWRFACYAQRDPLAALERFERAYMEQRYPVRPTAEEVTAKSRAILSEVLQQDGAGEILDHPFFRLNVMAVRSRGLAASERRPLLLASLGLSALANAASRRALGWFYERALFYDRRTPPPFFDVDDFPIERIGLDGDNLADAVLATGAIPLVLQGVSGIAGAPPGVYRDGGIIDYHFDMAMAEGDRLVLYPHFFGHLIPGWFDKALSRRARAASVDRVLLLSPSEEFVARLPNGRIPDRHDFERMDDETRIVCWRRAIDESRRLGDELAELLARDALASRVEPL